MEGSIETGDLRNMRDCLQDRLHRPEIMWLMQRRQRNELGQIGKNLLVQQDGRAILHTAMHNTMSDAENWRPLCQPRTSRQYFPRRCLVVETFRGPATLFNRFSLRVLD